MSRPLFARKIEALESEFAARPNDTEFLRALLDELEHRSTQRAARLTSKVAQALSEADSSPAPDVAAASDEQDATSTDTIVEPEADAYQDPAADDPPPQSAPRQFPPISDVPDSVLAAWTALEVLSPQSFRRETDLTGGDRSAIVKLNPAQLPWNVSGGGRKNYKLYHQVVLGTVRLDAAVAALVTRYGDTLPERQGARGEAIIASILLDRSGLPVEEPAVSISSFAWGVPKALSSDLKALGDWKAAEQPLIERLDRLIRRYDSDGQLLPLDAATIDHAYQWLVTALQLPPSLINPPRFIVRTYQYFRNAGAPEPLLLNSFFLQDLTTARRLWREGRPTANLRRYLGVQKPSARSDLLHDHDALADAVAPARFPLARWPGPGRHPLVLLQQAAVNLAAHDLESDGMLAVNGPPGTGKTTLLRDIVAHVVTQRAEVMAAYADPEDAFTNANQRINVGGGWIHLYKLDARLRGFEMLVASSNNKAVENVSAELPGQNAIAADAADLRYFKCLSDGLLEAETWGLIAAVLGNAQNRSTFRNAFWWDEDVGLAKYLAHAAGTPQVIGIKNENGEVVGTRTPLIIKAENAPQDHRQALLRWQQARKAFRAALTKSVEVQKQFDAVYRLQQQLPALQCDVAAADQRRTAAEAQLKTARTNAAAIAQQLTSLTSGLAELQRLLAASRKLRPGIFARLFKTTSFRQWSAQDAKLRSQITELSQARAAADKANTQATAQLRACEAASRDAVTAHDASSGKLRDALEALAAWRLRIGPGLLDHTFADRGHAERQQLAPWYDEMAHRARDDLFAAAMALHKAFIDCAAKPLRHNLNALMNMLAGRKMPDAVKAALVPDLWSSLFLVVPAVSTTFASVERMLGTLPPESLGWLLIDEAGQALPQAAVGALLRTKRAVIVGDPIQIEPVVVLPDVLTQAICRTFAIDPDRFNAPIASVQTLADAATPYVAEFAGRQGSRTVGVPLLVHRRCANPMFGISNAVAYEHLMVHSTPTRTSPIRDLLGPSRWFDVQGSAHDKWCPEEGRHVLQMLQALQKLNGAPDLYIVTPFVVVQDNLRTLIRDSGIAQRWADNPTAWLLERIGTVHTVQGREAEAVIFVLGAPATQQNGARGWAGGRPNLLNVAVTRAKEVVYVVGNRALWRQAGVFKELDRRLPK